jgi:hypothetical protein
MENPETASHRNSFKSDQRLLFRFCNSASVSFCCSRAVSVFAEPFKWLRSFSVLSPAMYSVIALGESQLAGKSVAAGDLPVQVAGFSGS